MIRKLRAKFVAVCMILVTAVLAVVFSSVYFSAERNIELISREILQRVLREDSVYISGGPSDNIWGLDIRPGDRVQLPYFTVEVWPNGSRYTAYVTGGTYANLENTEELETILTDCLQQSTHEGTISSYNLRYLRQSNGLFQEIAFVDTSMEQATLKELMSSYLQIGFASFLLLLGVSILLAHWATVPVERAWRQQRQFLSDASHELKTPLTVILSNASLLEDTALGEPPSRWVDNIHSEAQQMKSLVDEMLILARADHMTHTAVMSEVSLSDVATDCALAFEPVAFEAGKPLSYEIEDQIFVLGDRDRLRQVVAVLLDNAIKYGREEGTITLQLRKMDRQIQLAVSNPGDPIPPSQLPHLFERFYRADASRGEQSGFGLGLSIASAIAAEHKGALRAESNAASTRFLFTMPLKK